MSNFCDFDQKNIFVTGASSGLGRATCVLLSRLKATVCLVGRDEARLRETISFMEGKQHFILNFDLREFDKYDEIFSSIVARMGKFDGMVHFAGIRKTVPLKVFSISHLHDTFEINYYAFVQLVKYLTKRSAMSHKGGSIVGVSSVASSRGAAGLAGYGSSKAALEAAVRSFACELAARQIRINCVAPGHVATEMNAEVSRILSADAYDRIVKKHPLGIGNPSDVANLTAFLLSDQARWITGTTITIDGGFSAGS